MNDSALMRFFGVVKRPETWLGILFHVLAFPLGLFYFIFLVVGLSLGVGLVVVWIGIPILLVVAGAWWLFAAFERVQAEHLLRADVPPEPRAWERVEGVWGKLRAHFGSAATWKDLAYLIAKLAFGIVSFCLLVTVFAAVGWLLAMPFFVALGMPVIQTSEGSWVPPLWLGIVSVPLGVLVFFVSLHLLNAWGWVCARWAELMFRGPAAPGATAPPAAPPPAQPVTPTALAGAPSPAPPATPPAPPAEPPPAAPAATPSQAPPVPAAVPAAAEPPAPPEGAAGPEDETAS